MKNLIMLVILALTLIGCDSGNDLTNSEKKFDLSNQWGRTKLIQALNKRCLADRYDDYLIRMRSPELEIPQYRVNIIQLDCREEAKEKVRNLAYKPKYFWQ